MTTITPKEVFHGISLVKPFTILSSYSIPKGIELAIRFEPFIAPSQISPECFTVLRKDVYCLTSGNPKIINSFCSEPSYACLQFTAEEHNGQVQLCESNQPDASDMYRKHLGLHSLSIVYVMRRSFAQWILVTSRNTWMIVERLRDWFQVTFAGSVIFKLYVMTYSRQAQKQLQTSHEKWKQVVFVGDNNNYSLALNIAEKNIPDVVILSELRAVLVSETKMADFVSQLMQKQIRFVVD